MLDQRGVLGPHRRPVRVVEAVVVELLVQCPPALGEHLGELLVALDVQGATEGHLARLRGQRVCEGHAGGTQFTRPVEEVHGAGVALAPLDVAWLLVVRGDAVLDLAIRTHRPKVVAPAGHGTERNRVAIRRDARLTLHRHARRLLDPQVDVVQVHVVGIGLRAVHGRLLQRQHMDRVGTATLADE